MSRCFPYPPTGFAEDAIKLQKERERAKEKKDKKDRKEKKDRKKERKEKEKAAQLLYSSEDTRVQKKRKHSEDRFNEDKDGDPSQHLYADEHAKKSASHSQEQLERSSLSEEHGLPSNSQPNHGSPESSQDSSKRRKITAAMTGQLTSGGSIFRIKLPIRKQRESEGAAVAPETLHRVTCLPANQEKLKNPVQSQNSLGLHSSVRQSYVQSCGTVQQSISSAVEMPRLPSQSGGKSKASGTSARCPVMESTASVKKSDCIMIDLELPDEKHQHLLSSFNEVKLPENHVEKHLIKKGSQQTETMCRNEEPCCSGRGIEDAREVKMSQPRRDGTKHNRSSSKLERKFDRMIGKFNPLPLMFEDTVDLGDQDWLFSAPSRKNRTCSSELLQPRLPSQPSSLQPRAVYMADVNMYQLPYVLPF